MSTLPNHIQEYLMDNSDASTVASKEIFRADNEDVDIKTDLSKEEITLISKLIHNDRMLKHVGLKPLYNDFLNKLMRLRISWDRKSRTEFVKINNADKTEDVIGQFGNLSNIMGSKK